MDKLDRRGEVDGFIALSESAKPRRGKRQQGPQPLTARSNQIARQLGDQRDVGLHVRNDGLVDAIHVAFDQRSQALHSPRHVPAANALGHVEGVKVLNP
ncbi:MAG: Uncharacterised protein [Rhodospirillaceae bacterium]|nr:MAG: Uncharacterised protein [Rhodospirillaceae bacterium]